MSHIVYPPIANLKDRIHDLVGEETVSKIDDTNAIGQWLVEGCYDVIRKLGNTPEQERFVKSTNAITGGGNPVIDNADEDYIDIVRVTRDEYNCKFIPANKIKEMSVTSSIYYPEDEDPVFLIIDGDLQIFPALGGGNTARVYYIPKYTISNWDTGTTAIEDFPLKYYEHITLYAAVKIMQRRMLDITNNQASNITTLSLPQVPEAPEMPSFTAATVEFPEAPVFNAPGISVNLGSSGPSGPLYYLETEEDPELVTSSLSIVDKELALFDKRMEIAKQEYEAAVKEFDKNIEQLNKRTDILESQDERRLNYYQSEQQNYDKAIQLYTGEITKFREHLASEAKKFDNEMLIIKNEYEWLQQQMQIFKADYYEKLNLKQPQNKE